MPIRIYTLGTALARLVAALFIALPLFAWAIYLVHDNYWQANLMSFIYVLPIIILPVVYVYFGARALLSLLVVAALIGGLVYVAYSYQLIDAQLPWRWRRGDFRDGLAMLFCPLNIVIFGWILWRTTLWIEFGPSLKFRTWLREEQLTWHDVYVVEIAPTVVRKGPIAIKYRLASLALEDGRVFNFRISNKDEQRLRELMKWLGRELVEGEGDEVGSWI